MSRHLSPRNHTPAPLPEGAASAAASGGRTCSRGHSGFRLCPHGHRSSPAPPPRPAWRTRGLSGQPRGTVKTIRHIVLHEEAGVDRGTPWIRAKAREAGAPGQAARWWAKGQGQGPGEPQHSGPWCGRCGSHAAQALGLSFSFTRFFLRIRWRECGAGQKDGSLGGIVCQASP